MNWFDPATGLAVVLAILISLPSLFALYLERKRERHNEDSDVYAVMQQTIGEMSQQIRELQQGRAEDHRRILELQFGLEAQRNYSRVQAEHNQRMTEYASMLAEQLSKFVQDVPPPPPSPPPPPTLIPTVDGRTLSTSIAELFNLDEIDDLAFRLGIANGNLEGTTVNKRARSLVEFMQRRGRLEELALLVRQLRPKEL